MAPPVSSPRPSHPDWTAETAERIESIVETVRDKTTVPVTKTARAVVYGLITAVMGVVAVVLLVIGLLRLHVYLPFDEEGQKVYATYFVLGAIFLVLGMFLWRKRAPKAKE
jgi:hypothetical protein